MTTAEVAFTVFAIATQALLLGFFAARRWSPRLADPRHGGPHPMTVPNGTLVA